MEGRLNSSGSGTFQTPFGASAALNGVTLSNGATYINNADATLSVSGAIANGGTIQINASGGAASTMLLTGNTTFTGGTISLSYNNSLYNDAGIGTNTQRPDLDQLRIPARFRERETLAAFTLVNNGTVNANVRPRRFYLGLSAPTTNTGVMEATNGGTLGLIRRY